MGAFFSGVSCFSADTGSASHRSQLFTGTAVDCKMDCPAFPALPESSIVTGEGTAISVPAVVSEGTGLAHNDVRDLACATGHAGSPSSEQVTCDDGTWGAVTCTLYL